MRDGKRGYFKIPMSNLETKPEIVRQIMGRCLIVRAETLLICDAVEYHAYSPDFRELSEGEQVPEYRWLVSEATETVTAQEIEP